MRGSGLGAIFDQAYEPIPDRLTPRMVRLRIVGPPLRAGLMASRPDLLSPRSDRRVVAAHGLVIGSGVGIHVRVLGMSRGAVVTLAEILDGKLPVRLRRIDLTVNHFRVGEPVWGEVGGEMLGDDGEVGGTLLDQIDEDQAFERLDLASMKTVSGRVEVVGHLARVHELAIETISPRVVRADKTLQMPFLLEAHTRATVTADVEMRVDLVALPVHDEDGFIGELVEHVVAWVRNLRNVVHELSLPAQDVVEVESVDLGARKNGCSSANPGC